MAGQRQKQPDQLVDRRPRRLPAMTVIPVVPGRTVPDPPADLGEHAVAAWHAFWRSPVSQAVDLDAHYEALRHWARCVDERERLWELWQRSPLIRGSHDQLITNPVFRQLRTLNEEIHQAETQFGMTPLAQLRLGVTFLAEQHLRAKVQREGRRLKPLPLEPERTPPARRIAELG